MKKGKNSIWLWEFSKRLVIGCTILYFIGMLYAAICIVTFEDTESLQILITNLNRMMQVCVFGYFAKAGIENTFKIKMKPIEDEEEDE